jgi:hypothetical protein
MEFKDILAKLLANGMNANALRNNDVLQSRDWEDLDRAVIQSARQRLVGVQDLISRGLVYPVTDGMGVTVIGYQTASDMDAAVLAMTPAADHGNDRQDFSAIKYLPLPLTMKGYDIDGRTLASSRRNGMPLDTMQAGTCGKLVAERIEEILFNGASLYAAGGGTIYGYTDFEYRSTGSLNYHWDDSAATGATIVDDVRRMKQKSIDKRKYGPWLLYVPTGYETKLDDNFVVNYPGTIRARIKEIDGIQDVKVADKLTADNVVLVEMQEDTVQIVDGMQPTNVPWETKGGLVQHMLVMAIMVPRLRADKSGRCGIVHFS